MGQRMKHTDIGDIPADWKLQTFEETFRVLSNNTLSRENLNNKGGAVRNIHYGDILTKFPEVLNCNEEDIPYLNDLSLITANTQLLQDGDVVIADTAEDDTGGKTIEVQNLGNGKLVAGLHTIPCRVKKGDFAPGWLGYYMNSYIYHDQIIPFITGIKVSSISKTAIAETIILVPPVEEQERIVETLSQLDSLIKQETSVSEKLNNVKSSCLSKIFPKDDEKKPEMRFPEFTDTWEQRKLGAVAKYRNGKAHENEIEDDGEYIVVNSKFVSTNGEVRKFSNVQNEPLYENEIAFVLSDVPNGRAIARTFLIDKSGKYTLNQRIAGITPHEDTDPYYLYIKMNRNAYFLKFDDGNKQTNLSIKDVLNYEDMYPSYKEQQKIGIYFRNLDNLITLHQRKCDKYKSIKAGLIRKLFP